MARRWSGKGWAWILERLDYKGEECLIWPLARTPEGYGYVAINGKPRRAHRVMCELVNGPAPKDRPHAAHLCGNGHLGCCTPKHLAWKNASENQKDRRRHGRPEGGIGRRTRLTREQIDLIQNSRGKISEWALVEQLNIKRGTIQYWRRKAALSSHQGKEQ